MNMNQSGHSEMRAPDWYSRSTDRAKLSPNTLETESLQNSLTSLNFDSSTVAALEGNDHYSVRSLPVIPSSSASIASAVDAPWNESPRSYRGSSSASVLRTPSAPSGMSPLDHLQNSISSITRPPINIITEEEDPLYLVEDTSEGTGEDLNGSSASMQMNGTNGEMDATAHAGNVSRSSRMFVTTSAVPPPVSPMRSPMRQSHSWAAHSPTRSFPSANASIASRGSRGSRGSRSFRHGRPLLSDEASLSTLGDGDDFQEEEDDDNLAIIKLLRNQVETLKSQLFSEQEKNQQLRAEALQSKAQSTFQMSYCSNSYNSFGNDCSSDGDSFGGDDTSSKCSTGKNFASQSADKFSAAQMSLLKSVDALRRSLQQRSQVASPVIEDDNALMLDELTLCELEGQAKTMQQVYEEQQLDWKAQRERWQEQMKRQDAKMKELKRQLAAKK